MRNTIRWFLFNVKWFFLTPYYRFQWWCFSPTYNYTWRIEVSAAYNDLRKAIKYHTEEY